MDASTKLQVPRPAPQSRWRRALRYLNQHKYIYLLALLPAAFYIIFLYLPMYGVTIAFKDFRYDAGIWGSPWAGLKYFERLFTLPKFLQVLGNTLKISLLRLVFEFPFPIIIALLLNEVRSSKLKRIFQTVYTFPNFVSWVVISGMILTFFSSDGIINGVLAQLGQGKQDVLRNSNQFLVLLLGSSIWKGAGWGSIIYLSALAGVDPTMYEAAVVDGANRWKQLVYITLPSIAPTIVVMLILSMANVMNAGFDQIFNMYNPTVYDQVDIIDTYVYRVAFKESGNFSFSTAVGLFKSVINCILLVSVNKLAHLMGQRGIY